LLLQQRLLVQSHELRLLQSNGSSLLLGLHFHLC